MTGPGRSVLQDEADFIPDQCDNDDGACYGLPAWQPIPWCGKLLSRHETIMIAKRLTTYDNDQRTLPINDDELRRLLITILVHADLLRCAQEELEGKLRD